MTITTDHKSSPFNVQIFDEGEKIANLPFAFIKHATGIDLFRADEKTTHKTLGTIVREFGNAMSHENEGQPYPLRSRVDLAIQGITSKPHKVNLPLITVPTSDAA